jgi:hypothetical protein
MELNGMDIRYTLVLAILVNIMKIFILLLICVIVAALASWQLQYDQ